MLENVFDTIIIGGGLSGLYAGYLLSEQSRSFVILEARKRTGGRILCPEYNRFFSDLGPSWYWPAINPSLAGLIQTLGLEGYRQSEDGLGRFEDPNGNIHTVRGYSTSPASFRLNGGMNALIKKLYERIPETAVKLDSPVCEIKKQEDGVHVHVGELEKAPRAIFKTQKIILALPPRLAAATILFTPDLPHRLEQAMLRIGTWMAGQAKFYALYDTPFWRDAGFSGQAFSQKGPVGEIHDGSNHNQNPYGLTGFFNFPASRRYPGPSFTKLILEQLCSIFGEKAARPKAFFYQDWAMEKFTATEFDQAPMYEHPVYQPPEDQTCFWDRTIHFAGSETADLCGGYLEGAINSARRAVSNLYEN